LIYREIHNIDKRNVRGDIVKWELVGGSIEGVERNACCRIAASNGNGSSRAKGDSDSCGKGARSVRVKGIFSNSNVPVTSVGQIFEVSVIGGRCNSLVGGRFPKVGAWNYSIIIARVKVASW